MTPGSITRSYALAACIALYSILVYGQALPQAGRPVITGTVSSGAVPIPGAAVTCTSEKFGIAETSTDDAGHYALRVAGPGKYTVVVSMTAFAIETREAVIDDATRPTIVNFNLTLQSRSKEISGSPKPTASPSDESSAPSSVNRDTYAVRVLAELFHHDWRVLLSGALALGALGGASLWLGRRRLK